jgi:hypothetical protein
MVLFGTKNNLGLSYTIMKPKFLEWISVSSWNNADRVLSFLWFPIV